MGPSHQAIEVFKFCVELIIFLREQANHGVGEKRTDFLGELQDGSIAKTLTVTHAPLEEFANPFFSCIKRGDAKGAKKIAFARFIHSYPRGHVEMSFWMGKVKLLQNLWF